MSTYRTRGGSFEDQSVLITGPTTGIGACLAEMFAAEGARLILVSRSIERLKAVKDRLSLRFSAKIDLFPADLSLPGSADGLVDAVRKAGLAVDVLVNNAGYGVYGRFIDEPLPPQLGMIELHIASPTRLIYAFLPGMVRNGRGGVLNVASTAGFQPLANQNVYSATKSYLIHFTEALAEEVSRSGVRVTCFCPGPTETPFFDNPHMKTRTPGALARMSAEEVARTGFNAFKKGKVLEIPGWNNKGMVIGVKFSPRFITRKVAAKIIERVLPEKK